MSAWDLRRPPHRVVDGVTILRIAPIVALVLVLLAQVVDLVLLDLGMDSKVFLEYVDMAQGARVNTNL